jgi:two-component system sensor histidine kinase/response regulator
MRQVFAHGTTPDVASGTDKRSGFLSERGLFARIATSAFIVAVGLALVFAVLLLAVVSLRQRTTEARHSQQVIATANRLQTLVIDLETGVRGFVITRDESYLAPWRRAQQEYPAAIDTLLRLTSDSRLQHRRALAIRSEIATYLSTYSRPLVDFMRRNPREAPSVATAAQGRQQVDTIRAQFSRFLDTERALSEARNDRARTTTRHAILVGSLGLAAALLLIFLGALYLHRAIARPVRLTAEAAARIAAGDFSERVPTDGPGEVGELERAFNTMAASLERTLADLEERNLTLVESERAKGELVSNVSHELRTPLASVLGFSALMLERDVSPEETRRYLEVIRTEASRLGSLLNDLLDLQRVEQHALELRHDVVDLIALLETQVTLYSAQSETHQLQLDAFDEPLLVRGDRDRLAQVIGNLLSNAIKYSPEGGTVEIAAELNDDEAIVRIRDSGLGIPADHQGRIFTKFFRGDVGRQRGIPGTGLGLVLAQQIAEAHGGEVGFDSEEGTGSTFWLRLPAVKAEGSLATGDDANARHGM